MTTLRTGLLALGALCAVAVSGAEIGETAPAFRLTDLDGKEHALEDFRGTFVVLEWINHDCPFVKKHYEPGNMPDLQKEFRERGVVWLAICSSAPGQQGNFTPEVWRQRNEAVNFSATALLLDEDGTVGRAYRARTTPHMYVIDPEGVLLYAGAIDDKPTANPRDIEGANNYVRQALNEALAGNPVSVPSTRAYGCTVKYAR